MDILTLTERLGIVLKNEENADELIDILKNKLQYYKEKNVHNEKWISKLKISSADLNFETQKTLENLVNIIEISDVDVLDVSDIGFSLLDNKEKNMRFTKKIEEIKFKQNQCVKEIHKLQEEIKNIQEEIEIVKVQINKIDSTSDIKINSLKVLIKKYQYTVDELMAKNIWINNDEYNSLSLQEELKKLYKLRNDADSLRNEIDGYKGLKPDLDIARKQLNDIKKEYEVKHNDYKKDLK